jgi:hypothetical protein
MIKNNIIDIVFETSIELNIPSVIIGGLALPMYNVSRTTVDIDISIWVKTQKQLNDFIKLLNEKGIETKQNPKINHDLFTIFGKSTEAEIWLKPCDAFTWDDEMVVKRIQFVDDQYVLSLEDYILTKLARMDRSSTDIQDILQIIINNIDRIDWNYLINRLKQNNLIPDFKLVLEKLIIDKKSAIYDKLHNILQKINDDK